MSEMIERVALASQSYAVMYSHETVGDDLRTVNRQWQVYRMEQATRDKPPTVFEASFTEKGAAYALCARLNARAAIEAMREPTEAMLNFGVIQDMDVTDIWQAMIDAALKPTQPASEVRG
jgi:hypothetical protein